MTLPTRPKPYQVLASEGKSHRTKAELERRKKAEEGALTGTPMKEHPRTKGISQAHVRFMRIRKLLRQIGKDDALYESVINRYCIITAEADDLEKERTRLATRSAYIDQRLADGDMTDEEYAEESTLLLRQKLDCDKALTGKRKMLFDIEKENLMTVAAALRSVPKAPQDDTDEDDPMAQLLSRGGRG